MFFSLIVLFIIGAVIVVIRKVNKVVNLVSWYLPGEIIKGVNVDYWVKDINF